MIRAAAIILRRAGIRLRASACHRVPTLLLSASLYAVTLLLSLGLSSLLVWSTGRSPFDAFSAIYDGSVSTGSAIGLTLDETMPILVVAIGVMIAMRAGMMNIGSEGQLLIGGAVGTAIALFAPGPGWIVLPMAILGAAAGGALWAGIAALMRFSRGVDVFISTLLLNFVALQVVSFLVNSGDLLGETRVAGSVSVPQSDLLANEVRLPRLGTYPDFNMSTGVVVALSVVVLAAVFTLYSRWGFRLRMLGLNATAARSAGVGVAALGSVALVLSGAFAGFAGGLMITGTVFRLQPGFSNSVGYEGLLVALVARNSPFAVFPVALFFGALRSGGGFLASTGVPRYLVDVVRALLVLGALFAPLLQQIVLQHVETRRARKAAVEHKVSAVAA